MSPCSLLRFMVEAGYALFGPRKVGWPSGGSFIFHVCHFFLHSLNQFSTSMLLRLKRDAVAWLPSMASVACIVGCIGFHAFASGSMQRSRQPCGGDVGTCPRFRTWISLQAVSPLRCSLLCCRVGLFAVAP